MKKLYLQSLVGCFLLSAAVTALTVTQDAVQQELVNASLVAEVEITQLTSFPHPGQYAQSEATAALLKVLRVNSNYAKGLKVGDPIRIDLLGGEINDLGATYGGYPRLYFGQRYTVHLTEIQSNHFRVAGWEFGVVPHANFQRGFSRNRTDGSNGSGDGPFLYWADQAFPVPYYISAPTFAGLSPWINAIDASFHTWRSYEDVRLEFFPAGCTDTTRNENDGINNVIFITKDWPFETAAIAVTRNFYVSGNGARGGMILDTDLLINGVNHSFTVSGEAGKHDLQNILTHEVGHFIGLGHEVTPTDSEATMFSVASPSETKKRTLAANDLNGLRSAYLGVGTKLDPTHLGSCETRDRTAGCAAAHSRGSSAPPASLFFFPLGLLLTLLAGRYFFRRPMRRVLDGNLVSN